MTTQHPDPSRKRIPRKPLLIAYARVSSERQSEVYLSLQQQFLRIKGFAKERGYTLHDSYYMDEASAWDDLSLHRPDYQAAIREAIRLRAGIVVSSVDRLSRSVAALAPILDNDIPIFHADNGRVTKRDLRKQVRDAQAEGDRISRDRLASGSNSGASNAARTRGFSNEGRRKGTIHNMDRRDRNVAAIADFLVRHPELRERSRREIVIHLNAAGVRNLKKTAKSKYVDWTVPALRGIWPHIQGQLEFLSWVDQPDDP